MMLGYERGNVFFFLMQITWLQSSHLYLHSAFYKTD